MSMYPDNLLYFVKKLSGYSRNNVKVLPLTSTTSGNGQVVQFRLPTNSLIDLSTWCMHGNMKVTGTGGVAAFGRDTASMIRNVQVQVGGQTVQHLNSYGTVWQALKQSTMSTSASASNKWLEFDVDPVTPSSNQSDATPFVIRNWLGFFQASPSIIDTSLLGEIVISLTIETDGKKYCMNAAASVTAVALELSDLFSSIDLISIQDGVYDMVAQQALASGLMLEIPVPNYFTFQHAAASDDYHTQFTIGCQSLDSAMVLQVQSGLGFNDNTVSTANGYKIQVGMSFDGYRASATEGDGWYFEVNGAQVPNHRINQHNTFYYQKLAFGIHGADHGNLVGTELLRAANTTDGWKAADVTLMKSAQYIPVVRFNHAASDKRLLSGIDARSNPVQISFHHKGTSGAAKSVTVVALCTSTLMVGAGQQLSFSA